MLPRRPPRPSNITSLGPCPAQQAVDEVVRLAHAQAQARAEVFTRPTHAGLVQALTQAPMVALCAVGPALEAARMAQASYSAVAQLPMWVLRPDEVEPMGAGLFRHAQLLLLAGDDQDLVDGAALHDAAAIAGSYHCPVVWLTDPGAGGPTKGWALPSSGGPKASHAAFALPLVGHLALVQTLARWRAPAAGGLEPTLAPEARAADGTAGREIYEMGAARVVAQAKNQPDWSALTEHCARARHIQLWVAAQQLAPAARACAAHRSGVVVVEGEAPAGLDLGAGAALGLAVQATPAGLRIISSVKLALDLPLPAGDAPARALWLHLLLTMLLHTS